MVVMVYAGMVCAGQRAGRHRIAARAMGVCIFFTVCFKFLKTGTRLVNVYGRTTPLRGFPAGATALPDAASLLTHHGLPGFAGERFGKLLHVGYHSVDAEFVRRSEE